MEKSPYKQQLEFSHTVDRKTTISLAKHVTIDCDLRVGMNVWFDSDFGYKLKDVQCFIEDIKRGNCQSGFLVKVDKYENYVDSDWFNLTPTRQ